jgi:acyl-CoA reductase-like NAD-dependent aldehyde dehydrogenase
LATETAAPARDEPRRPAPDHPTEQIVRDRLYIGGQWVEPAGSGTIDVVDSTTEQVIGRIPEGTADDVDRAVEAARAGFAAWREVPVESRVDACTAISAALAERGDEIAALVAAEVGMPLAQARTIQAGLPAMDFGARIDCS